MNHEATSRFHDHSDQNFSNESITGASDTLVSTNMSLAIGTGMFHILSASDTERKAAPQEKCNCINYFKNQVSFPVKLSQLAKESQGTARGPR